MSGRVHSPPKGAAKSGVSASGSSRNATRRLLKELDTWRVERKHEAGIERLGPVSDEDLLEWEAVINGRGIGYGYDGMFLFCFSFLYSTVLFCSCQLYQF